MKKIVIVTSTRAEYGLLKPVILGFLQNNEIDTHVVVTGTHLMPEYGMTVHEIEQDGIQIDQRIEMNMNSDSSVGISKTMALALISFSEYFNEIKPDALMILGDRYESLAISIAAMNTRIPIIHLHGGEATEGMIDEAIRNSITKMSYLHFTSTEAYRKRVIQMGEDPSRVYNVGALGVENIRTVPLMTRDELQNNLGINLSKYAVLTFHPVTLEEGSARQQVQQLIHAITNRKDILFVCTKANADMDGKVVNEMLEDASESYDNIVLFDSLGMKRYLSALRYAEFVIGNSSSGIIEAPSFHVPTINIGDRQKGRIQSGTTINCEPISESITNAIRIAQSEEFRNQLKLFDNPYEKDGTSEIIVRITTDYVVNQKIDIKKKFYDMGAD